MSASEYVGLVGGYTSLVSFVGGSGWRYKVWLDGQLVVVSRGWKLTAGDAEWAAARAIKRHAREHQTEP